MHVQLEDIQAMYRIVSGPPPQLLVSQGDDISDFLCRCLCKQPHERWSVDQLLTGGFRFGGAPLEATLYNLAALPEANAPISCSCGNERREGTQCVEVLNCIMRGSTTLMSCTDMNCTGKHK